MTRYTKRNGLSRRTLLKTGVAAKIVFVRDRRNKGWLAVLSPDVGRSEEEIVRIYGKRWDIEVLFQMAKQHLIAVYIQNLKSKE